uniref:BLVR domain-containing protein n=1 Tax=Strongyloides papillosus TaxID=174720 RepID=A0A0N5C3L3_STREA
MYRGKKKQSVKRQNDQVEADAGQSVDDPLVTSNEAVTVDDQVKTSKHQDKASDNKYRTSKSNNTLAANTVTSKKNIYYVPFSDEEDH